MANRRFEMYEYRQIIMRMRSGESDRDIRKAGLMGRKKAAALREIAREEGWLDPQRPLVDDATLGAVLGKKPRRGLSPSLVAPYEQEIRQWHEQGIMGTTILQALVRKHAFEGSYSSLRRFLQSINKDNRKATVILGFEPGEAAQVDFGKGPEILDANTGELISTWVFVMTLAWSRHMYAELVTDQRVATWLGCHRRAFEWFGGVPSKVIIDNAKCAITRACRRDPEVNRSYFQFAEGYGFVISPCPPGQPQMKGIVENGIKYFKGSFVPLREIRSVRDGNRQLMDWVMGTAANRIHGTTKERPLTRFTEVERHLLKPLPDVPPELACWKQAVLHGNCHLQFDNCFYSSPHRLVHRKLWVRATEKTVEVFHEHELVAVHPRLHQRGSRSTIEQHLPPNALAYKMRDPQWCLQQAAEIGPHSLKLIETLFEDRVLDNLKAAQGLISLAKKYGASRLEAGCARAMLFADAHYRTVKTILERGLDQLPPDAARTPLAGVYTGSGRFLRRSQDLLH